SAQAECLHRLDEKLVNLFGAFAVAPVADPYQVACRFAASGMEDASVGRFVPGPDLLFPALCAVDVADHVAVGEHTVVTVEIVAGHVVARGEAAMVRVMEQELVIAAPRA